MHNNTVHLEGDKEPVPGGVELGVLNHSCWECCLPRAAPEPVQVHEVCSSQCPQQPCSKNGSVQGEPRHLNTHPGEKTNLESLRALWPHGFGPVAHSYPNTSDRKPLIPSAHKNPSWISPPLPSQIRCEAEVNSWINTHKHCTCTEIIYVVVRFIMLFFFLGEFQNSFYNLNKRLESICIVRILWHVLDKWKAK